MQKPCNTSIGAKETEFLRQALISNPNISATQCQTINSVRSNNLSLKYQRFTRSGGEDIGIRKFEFVAKTQFLCITM